MKIEIITRFPKDDPKCIGDYSEVAVKIDGENVVFFGDYYHDKGEIRAESFVEGIRWALKDKNIYVEELAVADFED